jgi:hypothetical protein
VSVPVLLGLVDPLPFKVTVLPTVTVWFGPALATGPRNDHCKEDTLKGTLTLTRSVNVLRLATCPPGATGGNWRVSWPASIWKLAGFKLDNVAVDAATAEELPLDRSALYV